MVVTGATGNVGSTIVSVLLNQGRKVRCIARTAENLRQFITQGAEAAAGTLDDASFLTKAFSGAEAVFAMIPPNYAVHDFRAYQNKIGTSIAAAIQQSGVRYVVNLSSQGAHLPDKTGPIKGLHDQEERLNKLPEVNILHIRPTYFMENLLMNIPMIKNMHMAGSAIRGDQRFGMVATKDIAVVAAERLMRRDFSGTSVRDLLGQRDLSLDEAISIIGKRVNKPDLKSGFPMKMPRKALQVQAWVITWPGCT